MKKFTYEARDKASSQVVKSMVQADSESAAARVLIEQGLMPLGIKEIDEDGSFFAKLSGRITTKDKILFLRQLSTLIGAGLPLAQSIHTVLEQTQNKQMQRVIEEVIADIEGGRTLSDAFGKHPQVFDKIVLALVAAGEVSGTLDEALKRVATQKEKDAAISKAVSDVQTALKAATESKQTIEQVKKADKKTREQLAVGGFNFMLSGLKYKDTLASAKDMVSSLSSNPTAAMQYASQLGQLKDMVTTLPESVTSIATIGSKLVDLYKAGKVNFAAPTSSSQAPKESSK